MWDQRYEESGFAYGTNPNDFLLQNYQHISQLGSVLCLAEGEGRNAVFLAQKGYNVTAVDQSIVGLNKALELANRNGCSIHTVAADLNEFRFGHQKWDGIVSIFAHLPKMVRERVHSQVVEALKLGGYFILEAYRPAQLNTSGIGGPKEVEMLMSLADLSAELEGLEIKMDQEIVRTMTEGKYHSGESAVVQILARKPESK